MRIEFHGAARGVTGSCHLIECAGKRILIDCGLYQGGHELNEENAQPFGFEPRTIDFVDALPRTPTGKILKRELRKPFWAGQERQVH